MSVNIGSNGFLINIEGQAKKNEYFLRVLYTNQDGQLTVMSLKPGEEIGEEVHKNTLQLLKIEQGKGILLLGNKEKYFYEGDVFIVPKGTLHNVTNTGHKDVKLYTFYSTPTHKKGEIIKKNPN